jgi:hypothetical protein
MTETRDSKCPCFGAILNKTFTVIDGPANCEALPEQRGWRALNQ